jgi:hypothetical protein
VVATRCPAIFLFSHDDDDDDDDDDDGLTQGLRDSGTQGTRLFLSERLG